jgi:RNA ligase (TIGR02306 family)
MTKFEIKDSENYAATVVAMPAPFPHPNADRLECFGIFGYTVISSIGTFKEGDLAVFFPAEAQLAHFVVSGLNLYRHQELNKDKSKQGYLEDNRRVRALKLRGQVSSGLVIPLREFTDAMGYTTLDFSIGDTFDTIHGAEICRKYRIKEPQVQSDKSARSLVKAFKRVDAKLFPVHVDTDQYLRNEHLIEDHEILIVTQKLHGTSGRFGYVPVKRKLAWYERALLRLGVPVKEYELGYVAGSRQVIKEIDGNHQHYYAQDLWNEELDEIKHLIPANHIIYGEIVGWTGDRPIQKGHTYQVSKGERKLLIYRVSLITESGELLDYSWDQVRRFCAERNLTHVPELWRGKKAHFTVEEFSELDFHKEHILDIQAAGPGYYDTPLPIDPNGAGADEGIAIRVERGERVPYLLKYKNASHYEYETKILDSGEVDLESEEG